MRLLLDINVLLDLAFRRPGEPASATIIIARGRQHQGAPLPALRRGRAGAQAEAGTAVDAKLREINVEYRAKRESQRLGPPSAAWLAAETGEAYKRFCVKQGQREGQFKTVALAYRKGFGFDLEAFVEGNMILESLEASARSTSPSSTPRPSARARRPSGSKPARGTARPVSVRMPA